MQPKTVFGSLKTLDLSKFVINENTKTRFMLAYLYDLESLNISRTMRRLDDNACIGVASRLSPCTIYAPSGFDFGTETDGPYFEWKSGYFRLPGSYVWGDVNHDGDVNVTDVMLTVEQILGIPPTDFHSKNADINEDGIISVADVSSIVDLVLK